MYNYLNYNQDKNINLSMSMDIDKRKYFFPKNYNIKPKFLGLIEYKFLTIISIVIILTYIILGQLVKNFFVKIQIIIIIFLPIILLSISGLNGEDISYIFKYIFNYYIKNKVHIYQK